MADPNLWRQYDIYQRYSLLRRVLDAVFPKGPVRVLDIGSGPNALCASFLPDRFEILLADTVTHERDEIVQLVAGEPLPFADKSIDVVLAMDVLEHVPPGDREALLLDLARVAGRCAIISYPRNNPGVVAAEDIVAQAHRSWFGIENEFLSEHLAYGLPEADLAQRVLGRSGFAVESIESSPLSDWLPFTVIDVMLLCQFGIGGPKDEFNRAVNGLTDGVSSRGEHYRTFTVAAREPSVLERMRARLAAEIHPRSPAIDQATAMHTTRALVKLASSPSRLGVDAVLAAKDGHIGKLELLLQQRVLENEERIATQERHVQQLEQQLKQQTSIGQQVAAAKDEHIRKLEALLRGENPASA